MKILRPVLVLLVILVGGCIQPGVTCNKPYIKVGDSCCLDQNDNNICDKDEKKSFDLNKVEITKDDFNIDLYLGGQGGPLQVVRYLTIKNMNDEDIMVTIGCTNFEWIGKNRQIQCLPWMDNPDSPPRSEWIEKQSSISIPISFYTYILPTPSKQGEYSTTIRVILKRVGPVGATEEEDKDKIMARTIEEIPIHINVHCATGCCSKTGEYHEADCNTN